ncbi:hypothetical protein [Metabacillus sp. FJAT-52054]|uniref:Uncharacterized protein n=1 Tax=Metabacillus sediminis TaxID=3117746 RepID=A0ABZ2NJ12_9BACI
MKQIVTVIAIYSILQELVPSYYPYVIKFLFVLNSPVFHRLIFYNILPGDNLRGADPMFIELGIRIVQKAFKELHSLQARGNYQTKSHPAVYPGSAVNFDNKSGKGVISFPD